MRMYTGKGDDGSTDLLGARVGKDDSRIELLGSLDETTSTIGFGRALASRPGTNDMLVEVQRDLYRIMAEIAFTSELRPADFALPAERVTWLEAMTDGLSEEIALPPHFVVPGETISGAALDVARTVSRRAEREAVHLHRRGEIGNAEILRYLNRLSSLLFILARGEESAEGVDPIRAKTGRPTNEHR